MSSNMTLEKVCKHLENDDHTLNYEKIVEMRGIEPRAFHMQSERSTTELHPRRSPGSF